MKKIFTLIAVAAMAFAAQAAEWTAADGTASCQYAPIYGYNYDMDQHNQMQYPAAELGMAAGSEITAMKFYTSTPDLVNAMGGSVKVSLANMDDVTPWTLKWDGSIDGDLLNVEVTTVAAAVTPSAVDGEWIITFDAPFTYTGAALLVDIEAIQTGTYKSAYFYGKDMGAIYAMSAYGYAGSKKGENYLPKVTFTYEAGGEEPGITTLAQANALEDAAEFTFDGDAVVTVFKNGYLFLRDESGYGMIAGVTGAFENGQLLNQGWSATKTSVNDGWVRYINAADLSASGETNSELAAAQKLTAFPDESMLNAYVYVENVTISGGLMPGLPMRALPLPDDSSISVTTTLWSTGWPASGSKNIYGVICKVNGEMMIDVCGFENYVEPQPQVLRGDVNGNGFVNMDDLTALINYLVFGTDINMPNSAACNSVDDTTTVNMDDLTALISFLVNGEWAN